MNSRSVILIVLCIGQLTTATFNRRTCGRLRRFETYNETEASIRLTWTIPDVCQPTISYNITYGTISGPLESMFFKWENESQKQIARVFKNLIPEKEYMFVITVHYNKNNTVVKRPLHGISGRASNLTVSPPTTTVSPPTTTVSPPTTTVSAKSTSVNGGAIAGGVIAFVLVVTMVMIALISVWLIKRRRKQRDRSGLHYISVVHGIGNKSRKGQLHSRPGYLQIVHEAGTSCAGYEVPCSSLNVRPGITLLPNETEYPRREIRACADSNSSINSVQVTTESIQTASVGTDHVNNVQIITKNKTKLVKPYAVVDVKDITTDVSLEAASHGVLDRLRAKRLKHEELLSNREALKKSFGLCLERSSTQVEQHTSTGRYYTVPIYVNLNIPMTVNPSYNKNKV